MIFKILNEKLDAYFNEEELEIPQEEQEQQEEVLADAEPEVVELVQDVTDEYGDLTIPEFIDALIKEEGKEENLEESLNEHEMDWFDLQNNLLTALQRKIKALKLPVVSEYPKRSDSWNCTIQDNFRNVKFSCDRTYNNAIEGHTDKPLTGHIYPNVIRNAAAFTIGLYPITKAGSKDPYRRTLQITLEAPICQFEAKLPEGWDKFVKYDGAYADAFCFNYIIDIEDYNQKQVINDVLFIFQQNSKEKQQDIADKEAQAKKDSEDAANEIEALKQARAQARANKKAATTTVKRALSKTSVINQIKALENPTEEQLAKILAAIQ